jgi:Uma2 family endonuclease
MTTAKRAPSVYEQFLAVPPHMVAEIIHGTLRTFPRPAPKHARASSRLGVKLGPFDSDDGDDGGPGGWVILDEPELRLHGHILVPDLAGWRSPRMPELPETSFFEVVPDWICEVLSPSTAATDRAEKMPIYADLGVLSVWLIDPIAATLETFDLWEEKKIRDGKAVDVRRTWKLAGTWKGNARARVPPFEAIELKLSSLWAR